MHILIAPNAFKNSLTAGDAAEAIKNNMGLAPATITDLSITGIAQEFATLSWTVPSDNDDIKPSLFQLYYSTQPITNSNLNSATKIIIKNEKAAGENYSYEANGLLGLTTYYFAITSTDRWGNAAILSNVVSDKTNAGPSIAVDDNSKTIDIEIDIANASAASHDITILNNAAGILRWNHFIRTTSASLSYDAASLHYPAAKKRSTGAGTSAGKSESLRTFQSCFFPRATTKSIACWASRSAVTITSPSPSARANS